MRRSWDNIILIGMPGSGKSVVGARLASELGYEFIDGDKIIEETYQKPLKDIIDELGDEKFLQMENEVLCGINPQRAVIAPGGSVCYEPEAIAHFRSIGTVVFLQVDYMVLRRRLGDLKERGVILKPEMTLKKLYNERDPLYRKAAHVMVEEGWGTIRDTVEGVRFKMDKELQGERR